MDNLSLIGDDDGQYTIRGIPNPSKVQCYCISTIQFLFSIPEIRKAILDYNDCESIETLHSKIEMDQKTHQQLILQTEQKNNAPLHFDTNSIICSLKEIFKELRLSSRSFKSIHWLDETYNNPINELYSCMYKIA